ncbi:MAG: nitroreductase family protein [Pikeienuella sp.]
MSYQPIPLPDRIALSDDQSLDAAEKFKAKMAMRHTIRDFAPTQIPQKIIETCVEVAGGAPSGANHQPWQFVAISAPEAKACIRAAAEVEEQKFYDGGGGDEWLRALEPIGTHASKPHLTDAPWLIVVFAERYGLNEDGSRRKNYYVPESVGIACGFLISALHHAGLSVLTHTPNPMKFLNGLCGRPSSEKPTMIFAVGHAADDATVPKAAKQKKQLSEILTILR